MNPQKQTESAGTTLAEYQPRNKSMPTLLKASALAPFKSRILPLALTFVAGLTAAISNRASADGPMDGGGGGAYVCRQNGKVQSAELIDLWEARNRPYKWQDQDTVHKLTIPYSDDSVDVQLHRALTKLRDADADFADLVEKNLKFIRSSKNLDRLPENVSVGVPPDAQNVYFKTGCPAEGMMYFDDAAQKLSLKTEVFRKLINNTNKAAALTHEAIYKAIRDVLSHGLETSVPVRRMNACLYANEDCMNLKQQGIELSQASRNFVCESKSYTAYVVDHGNQILKANGINTRRMLVQFSRIGDRTYIHPITTEFFLFTGEDRRRLGPGGAWSGIVESVISKALLGYFSVPFINGGVDLQANDSYEPVRLVSGKITLVTGQAFPDEALDCRPVQ